MPKELTEVPTMFIEIIDQQDSGYVRDDTAGTPYEEKITYPGVEFIPNTGKRAEAILDPGTGKETGRYAFVPIRYIKGCPYIDVADQDKYGWRPSPLPQEDAIQIIKGKAIVKGEGDVALFDYLEKVFYNINAPHRSVKAKAIFKVIEVEKQTEVLNEMDFIQADAVKYVQGLVIQTGKNTYKYKEDKIDNILTILGLYGGDNYPQKVNVLTSAAKTRPKDFLTLVMKSDDQSVTEVSHALELNVIQFQGNTVEFVEDSKIVASLGEARMSTDKKISALAELLRTPEYAQAYQEMKVKTEIAQEKSLKA